MIKYNNKKYKIQKTDYENHCYWIDAGKGFIGVSFFIAELCDQ